MVCFSDLDELTPNEFLGAFLEVIRSEDTTGPITGLALTSVNKFLSYGLIGKQVLLSSVTVSLMTLITSCKPQTTSCVDMKNKSCFCL